MAYIPPHKRHSKEANPTTPEPAPTPCPFHTPRYRKIRSRWFVIPSNDQDGELSCSLRLKEFTVESTVLKDGNTYMILVSEDHHPNKEVNENVNRIVKSSWVSITEKIQQDLLTSFQTAREAMCKDGPELNLPSFVIRFGKVLFQRSRFDSLEAVDNATKSFAVENILSPLRKRFYNNVPESFCEAIFGQFIQNIGLDFLEDKENYYVKVYDEYLDVTTLCKSSVTEAAGELQLYQMGSKKIRQMGVTISCLEKNLDLRLLLTSKRIFALTEVDKQSLTSLVNSAVMCSKEEGSLNFSVGKKSVCGRYVVVGISHMNCRVYKNSFMKLKMKQARRFDFRTSIDDVSHEVNLKIPKLTSQLRDATMELNPLIDTVRDTLKLVWENFLCWEGSFT